MIPDESTSLQTTVAAEARLIEGQFLFEDKTLNKEKFLQYHAGTRRLRVFEKKRTDLKPGKLKNVTVYLNNNNDNN